MNHFFEKIVGIPWVRDKVLIHMVFYKTADNTYRFNMEVTRIEISEGFPKYLTERISLIVKRDNDQYGVEQI